VAFVSYKTIIQIHVHLAEVNITGRDLLLLHHHHSIPTHIHPVITHIHPPSSSSDHQAPLFSPCGSTATITAANGIPLLGHKKPLPPLILASTLDDSRTTSFMTGLSYTTAVAVATSAICFSLDVIYLKNAAGGGGGSG
jgi:hypothetical protein